MIIVIISEQLQISGSKVHLHTGMIISLSLSSLVNYIMLLLYVLEFLPTTTDQVMYYDLQNKNLLWFCV